MYLVIGTGKLTNDVVNVGPFESRNNAELAAGHLATRPNLVSVEITSEEENDEEEDEEEG